jgi:hypothetical protein
MGQTEFVHSTAPGSPCRSASEAARFDPRVVGSAREGSDGDEGLGSLEEEGELPARSPGRGPLRSLQVHVSTTGARRLSLGPRADPRLGHLRQVHAPPLTGPNRLGSRIAVAVDPTFAGRSLDRSLIEFGSPPDDKPRWLGGRPAHELRDWGKPAPNDPRALVWDLQLAAHLDPRALVHDLGLAEGGLGAPACPRERGAGLPARPSTASL